MFRACQFAFSIKNIKFENVSGDSIKMAKSLFIRSWSEERWSYRETTIFQMSRIWGLEPLRRDALFIPKPLFLDVSHFWGWSLSDAIHLQLQTTAQKLTQPLRKGCRRHWPPHATKQTNGDDKRLTAALSLVPSFGLHPLSVAYSLVEARLCACPRTCRAGRQRT